MVGVEELEKQLETVMEGLVKKDRHHKELIHNACLILQAIWGFKHINQGNLILNTPESAAQACDEFDKVVEWLKYGDEDFSPTRTWDEIHGIDKSLQTLEALLALLPTDSVDDDETIVSNLCFLTSKSKYSAVFLGRLKWDINKLLNPNTIESSYSNANLQAHMAEVLFYIVIDEVSRTYIVQNCPHAMPFLVRCLRGPTPKIRKNAAAVVKRLTEVDSNRKKIGESGAIKALIELIQIGDLSGTFEAVAALLNLCTSVVENRERAVSDGAVITAIGKIRKRVLMAKMLKMLKMLIRSEKAIAEMEENGMFEVLFMILGETASASASGKSNEYCMFVVHTMCHLTPAKTRRIDEVENGRKILQSVVSRGTTEAREKASDLLWRLDLLDLVHTMFSK